MKKYKFTATRSFTQLYEITIKAKNEKVLGETGKVKVGNSSLEIG